MTRGARWVLYAAALALFLFALVLALEPSERPALLIYSRFKLLVIGVTVLWATLLLCVARTQAFAVPALCCLASAVLALLTLEMLVRVYPLILPYGLLSSAPPEVRLRAGTLDAARERQGRGRLLPFGARRDDFVLEGLHRRFVPGISGVLEQGDDFEEPRLAVVIDEAGYRNPPGLYASTYTFDLILLGDSFVFGTSRLTIADVLRGLGNLEVYSLGNIGDGPQQWALHFQRFLRTKRTRLVAVNFYEGNDIENALVASEIVRRGLPGKSYWHAYTETAEAASAEKLSARIFNFVGRSALVSMVRAASRPAQLAIATISGKKSELRALDGAPEIDARLVAGLGVIERVLKELKQACMSGVGDAGCGLVVSYVPSNATVHGSQFTEVKRADPRFFVESYARQREVSGRLAKIAARVGAEYVDVTPKLRELGAIERLYNGYHFNARGYRRYAELFWDELRLRGLVNGRR